MSLVTKQQAAAELLARRQARANYIDYCKYVYDGYLDPWHVEAIADKLAGVERGDITRLIITTAPRHSKSLNASVLFPSWYLGRNPTKKVVQAGHGAGIARRHSQDARRIVGDKKHQTLWPGSVGKLTDDLAAKKSVAEWETSQGGSYFATGVGGELIGRGADLMLLDDLYKSREDAGSTNRREKVLDWYKSTVYTRLEPGGAIIIIMTRWHPDDLVGYLLKHDSEQWDVLELPAIDDGEDGYDALWPARYPADKLNTIRQTIGLREWSAQYMCSPVIETGNMFDCSNVDIIDDKDFPEIRYLRVWDLASTAKERNKNDPDYTVGVLGAVTKDAKGCKHLWIKEMIRGQWEAPERNRRIIAAANHDGSTVPVYVEAWGAYKDTFKEMQRLLSGRNIVRSSRLPGDKILKASILEPIFEAGNVHMAKAVWNDHLIQEFLAFPDGSHDDIVDAVSIIAGESNKAKSSLMVT